MPYSINNIAVPNAYSDTTGTLYCPNSKNLTVQVFNANVYYQLALGTAGVSSMRGGEVWTPETLLSPALWNFRESDFYGGVCHSIRFRNAVSGTIATVTASA